MDFLSLVANKLLIHIKQNNDYIDAILFLCFMSFYFFLNICYQ